ncbi:MAG: biotin/lipoyl-binding protein [Alistipes sp.]|nr:biotin/lipoyl-binding protein [Alistipes sp.]
MKDYSLKINGNKYDISIDEVNNESTLARVVVNGVAYEVEIEGEAASKAKKPQVVPKPKNAGLSVTPTTAAPSAPAAARAQAVGSGFSVKCPLPGTIIGVNVKEGDRVAVGQTVVVLEAMKMENNIDAERAGVVKSIHVQKGATVMEGDLLIVIE